MALLIAIHRPADNSHTYLKHYFEVHVPLAKALPGLREYQVSRGSVVDSDGKTTSELVALLQFDSRTSIEAALKGPEGQAALNDLPNFARPGQIELLIFDADPIDAALSSQGTE